MINDPYDLQRFVDAQEPIYESALLELREGEKRGHWMWFVFPQIRGLGSSPMAQSYAIRSREEAVAYAAHPLLGQRLTEAVEAVLDTGLGDAYEVFGDPDYLKFRSCMTLFANCAPSKELFVRALEQFYDGRPDGRTRQILQGTR